MNGFEKKTRMNSISKTKTESLKNKKIFKIKKELCLKHKAQNALVKIHHFSLHVTLDCISGISINGNNHSSTRIYMYHYFFVVAFLYFSKTVCSIYCTYTPICKTK